MQTLRNAHLLARFVLVWFALFLGVAIAAPIVNPQASQMVCSATGSMKLVSSGDSSGEPAEVHALACPLCASFGAPLYGASPSFEPSVPLSQVVQGPPVGPLVSTTAAPLPARGPPALL